MIEAINTWGWPQWIYCFFVMLGLMVHAVENGKPLKGDYNVTARALGAAFWGVILWQGGFFG